MKVARMMGVGIVRGMLILSLSLVGLQAGTLENIKGTYTPLKDNYKHCSPMMGAIWWEHPYLLKNLYLYGEIKLIKELFYIAQGNFTDTSLERKTAYHLSPEIIGKIVGVLEIKERVLNKLENKKRIGQLNNFKTEIIEEIKLIVTQDEYFKKSIKKTDDDQLVLDGEVKALKEKISQEGLSESDKNSLIEQIRKKQTLITQKETKVALGAGLDELAASIFNLFRECVLGREVPYLATDVLLAFLYKKDFIEDGKVVSDREKFKRYFKALEDKAKDAVFVDPQNNPLINDIWLNEQYQPSDVNNIREKIKNFIQAKKDTQDLVNELLKEVSYEDIVYAEGMNQWYRGALPKIAGFKWGVKYKDKDFPDCVETVIRNLCNIVLYDSDKQMFGLSKVPNARESLKKFYATYSGAENINEKKLNDDWTEVVENLDGIIYWRLAKEGIPGFFYGTAFIRIDDKIVKLLGDIQENVSFLSPAFKQLVIDRGDKKNSYDRVILKDYFIFEMKPSLANVIMAMNTLLGLNLYTDPKVIFDKDFNSTYFPQLCKALQWQYSCDQKLDNDVNLAIRISYGATSFIVEIRPGHGEITGITARKQENYENKLFERLSKKEITSLPMVFLYNDYEQRQYQQLEQDDLFAYNCLPIFYMELSDNKKLEFIKAIVHNDNPKDIEKNLVKSFIKNTRLVEDLHFHVQLIEVLASKYKDFEKEFISIFNALIKSDSVTFNKNRQLKLLELFVQQGIVAEEKGKGYTGAIAAAQEDIKNSDPNIRTSALNLFKALIDRGLGYDEARVAAQANPDLALGFYDALVRAGQGYTEAIAVAQKGIKDWNISTRCSALKLFENLVEKHQGYSEAKVAAQECITSKDQRISSSALELYKALIKRGRAYDDSIKAVQIVINIPFIKEPLKKTTQMLFDELIKKIVTRKEKYPELAKKLVELAKNPKISVSPELKPKVDELTLFITDPMLQEAKEAAKK